MLACADDLKASLWTGERLVERASGRDALLYGGVFNHALDCDRPLLNVVVDVADGRAARLKFDARLKIRITLGAVGSQEFEYKNESKNNMNK